MRGFGVGNRRARSGRNPRTASACRLTGNQCHSSRWAKKCANSSISPLYNRSWHWEPIVIERNRDPGAVCRAVSLVMPSKMVVGRKQHARLIENRLEALLFIHEVPSAVATTYRPGLPRLAGRAQHRHDRCPGPLIGAKTGHFCATLCQEV